MLMAVNILEKERKQEKTLIAVDLKKCYAMMIRNFLKTALITALISLLVRAVCR